MPGDQPALLGRNLVGQDGGLRGEGGVEEDLTDAPADEDDLMFGAVATTTVPTAPDHDPVTIQGRRIPDAWRWCGR